MGELTFPGGYGPIDLMNENYSGMERNRQVVRTFIENIINTGSLERISDYIDESYTEIYEGKEHKLGIDGARKHVEGVRAVFPDLKLEIIRQIAEGDTIVSEYVMTGTFVGEWMGRSSNTVVQRICCNRCLKAAR